MKTKGHLDRKSFSAYLDDLLPEKGKEKIRAHLDSCAECREVLREMEAVRRLLRDYPVKEPGPGLQAAILNRVEAEKKPILFRAWSRRASLGLGGLALLLVAFLFLHRPDLPFSITETEKTAVLPRPQLETPGKSAEKKGLATAKSDAFESGISGSEEEKSQKQSSPELKAGANPGMSRQSQEADREKANDVIAEKVTPVVNEPISASQPSYSRSEIKKDVSSAEKEKLSLADKKMESGGNVTVPGKPAAAGVPAAVITAKLAPAPAVLLQNTVIRTDEDWNRVWNVQNTVQNLSAPLPPVDFKNQMVIAVPTRQDHREYLIVKTEDKDNKIIVRYREVAPGRDKDEKKPLPPYQLEVVNNRPVVEFQKTY